MSDGLILIQCFDTGLNCTPPAIDDFPKDFFSEKERQDGAVVVHVVVSLYLFVALAVVCDKFFVPAVEKICHGKDYPIGLNKIEKSYNFIINSTNWNERIY